MAEVLLDTDVGKLWYPEGDGGVTAFVSANGFWERAEAEQIRKCLRSGDTFIDVGAHIGYFSVLAAQIVGDTGQVLSIEPEFSNATMLAKNLEPYTNTCMFQAAAWKERATLDFFISSVNSGDNRMFEHPESLPPVKVPAFPLDDLYVSNVSCIKIDTQGHDHSVVEGALKTIERCRPRIVVEWWPEGMQGAGVNPTNVLLRYTDLDYKVIPLTQDGILPTDGYCSLLLEPLDG
jgi:FkbM family methyltransferase